MKHLKTSIVLFLGLTMVLPAVALAQSYASSDTMLLAFGAPPDNSPNYDRGRGDDQSNRHEAWQRAQRDRDDNWNREQRDKADAWRNRHSDRSESWHRDNRYENSEERRQDEQRRQRENDQHRRDEPRRP